MDEVDVDNVEDLIELEARLYAQIHHEATTEVVCDEKNSTFESNTMGLAKPLTEITTHRTVTATSVVNKLSGNKDGRYWSDVSRQEMAKQDVYQKNQKTAVEKISASLKPAEKVIVSKDTPVQDEVIYEKSDILSNSPIRKSTVEINSETPNPTSNNTIQNLADPENTGIFEPPNTKSQTDPVEKLSIQNVARNKPPKQKKIDKKQQNANFKKNKDLRVNPAAKKQRNEPHHMKVTIPPNISKDGPFAKQVQKLCKAIRFEAKKQKSKDVKARNKQGKLIETIVLESTDSENDDVIVVPVPPPPTYSIDDSDEDKSSTFALKMQPTTSFAKPQKQQQHQQQPNSSRCTSPCSVLSSDDFIGQTDRCRLLEDSGMADDEDLLLLTVDVDSLMELPKSKDAEKTFSLESNDEQLEEVSLSDVVCTDFITPQVPLNIYRVEQTQFRALDVYESESDITDSVYSKGKPKSRETIIRTVESNSSLEDDDVEVFREKIKRLRKRRASGSNRESDTNNDGQPSSDSDPDELGTSVGLPFIVRGIAVEHYKTKPKLDYHSSISRRRSGGASVGHMSDSEFIATLNTLAQGANNEKEINDIENSDSDNEAPTARAIAEQVLAAKTIRQHYTSAGLVTERSASESEPVVQTPTAIETPAAHDKINNFTAPTAVPDKVLTDLDKVFKTIDKLDKWSSPVFDVSDESSMDTDVEIADELTQSKQQPEIIPEPRIELHPTNALPPEKKTIQKLKKMPDDPVYNIVYSEENEFAGGLGWNDEMRRFYNDSWKGERFSLRNIWSQMDANKNLWKIYTEDRFPKIRRFMNLKCHNCCEFGHTRAKCTRPKKPLVCYMCGELGHYEPRCPNTICLRCGNKTQVFTKSCNACIFQNRLICPVCKVRGHTLNLCPDKWRRYHSTTQPNAYPNSRVEYSNRKCCSICAGRGHLSENCKSAVRFLEYPIFVSDIKSHQKSYNDHAVKSLETGIGFNLLYKPEEDVSFELAENTTAKDYYGRFLKAVGMDYMLKRKRKGNVMTSGVGTPAKNIKKNHEQYVPNPYLRAGQQARIDRNEPEQVQEISESGNVDKDTEVQIVDMNNDIDNAVDKDTEVQIVEMNNDIDNDDIEKNELIQAVEQSEEPQTSTFKSPVIVTINTQLEISKDSEPMIMDSDSNYSFSEHFELSSTSNASPKRKSRKMGPLPDFIPLTNNASQEDDNHDDDSSDVNLQTGISKKYITAEKDDDSDPKPLSPLPDLPCEAKIYLTHFHSKYLLSAEGHKFLAEKSKETDLKARLDWTSVGHVLIIFGLQCNQDKFHRELLLKYRQLSDQMNLRSGNQKVPRRIDVLVKFLRENINLLMTNLGNVNELLKRLQYLEDNRTSKNEWKISEKTRRSLNMILLGQAGLCDGSHHLDKLLLSLKKLLNDFKGEDITPNELRNEIDQHWKMIFSSYRHDNYPELVQHYNNMLTKNRIPKLNIDPILLGGRTINTHFTKEQKARMENSENQKNGTIMENKDQQQSPAKDKRGKQLNIVPNPFNPKITKSSKSKRNSSPPPPPPSVEKITSPDSTAPPAPSMKLKSNPVDNFVPPTNSLKLNKNDNVSTTPLKNCSNKSNPAQPPFANPEQKSTATSLQKVTQNWENTCNNLLKEIDNDGAKKNPVRDCKAPSMFWSRESIKFVDECIEKVTGTNNTGLMEKLTRVQEKSKNGQLSYNDYRAVIKIHNAILGK